MLWKSRWTGDWFLRKAADQPNRARIQDNQILISAYDEILSKTFDCYCLMTGELPVRPRVTWYQIRALVRIAETSGAEPFNRILNDGVRRVVTSPA
jgi:hypothetical protein